MTDDLASIDLATLRARRDGVRAEETAVSYQRRLVQAQLDIVAGFDEDVDAELEARLSAVLADEPGEPLLPARAVRTVVEGLESPAALPEDLRSLSPEERALLVEQLTDAERRLSGRRRALLDELDLLQEELVRRYRDHGVDTASLLEGGTR